MILSDVNQYWGGDISAASNGDLAPATDMLRGQQRILRRLLTNPLDANGPADYVFHPAYGAGLPRMVGTNASVDAITALIRGQMLLENAVAKTPAPQIVVTAITNGISVNINYTDAATGNPAILSFNVNQ